MKRQISILVSVLGLLMVAACANAQTLKVAAKVPFDFVIDKSSLPAGNYTIDAIGSSKALIVRGAEGGKMVQSDAAVTLNPSASTRLLFHRYGDQYFLSQIWVEGESEGRQLHMSRREAEVAKNTQASQNVIVLASLR